VKQGTEEWRRARLGKVTSSRFAEVMTGGAGKTAHSYMLDLIGERLTGEPSEELRNKYVDWGHEHEASARAAYAWQLEPGSGVVTQVGFVPHPDLPEDVGGSPDGLVGDDGLMEIKCPYTLKAHLQTLLSGEVPSEYFWQCQGNLWVTGRKWLDYVSFHPRLPEHLQLCVIRVERDEDQIEELERKVKRFVEQLHIKLDKLNGKAVAA
jgi:predicted phage-related endonuclease